MNHICKCGRIVEHRAHNMCGKCWTMKYSTQYINGEHVPYVEMFKQSKGAKLPDETREELVCTLRKNSEEDRICAHNQQNQRGDTSRN